MLSRSIVTAAGPSDGFIFPTSSSGGTSGGLGDGGIGVSFDGGGATIPVGQSWEGVVPFGFTIVAIQFIADQAGDFSCEIATQAFATFNAGAYSNIHGPAPSMTADDEYEDVALASFTTTHPAGTCVRLIASSVSLVTRVMVLLQVLKG